MREFLYEQPARRVIFGIGTLSRLPDEVKRLGQRALVLSTPEQRQDAENVSRQLGKISVGVFANAAMHVPIDTARAARAKARELGADVYVAVGGGSTIGLGKAIALETSNPIVAVPTTFAGSEMTPIYGLTERGVKRTARDNRVLPKTVIYDPTLTLTLPARIAGPSGMNALAHCVEALYAPDGNPVISLMATEGIRALARSLPIVVCEPTNLEARGDALYGAWLAGISLGATSMSLHHKLCHTLGGTFNLAHADVHTVVLPHATAYNSDAAPEAMRAIADALGAKDAAQGIYDLAARIGAPRALKDIGMPADGLDKAADLAMQNPYDNPSPLERSAIRQLLENAYHGTCPT
ncbi:MAG: maleylacetate reductase [Acidobacteria bacterium RIFCSPLOWO2_12_FULL_65_11]|nr:MAG: maleylacetate reductase [Acidobacteria bacterium RIFCSPLOWO2_02_FULL_64_15]OFW31604.1 MAG: maleylacetate reductase [Acidobacteria bacterium RIFCSPLOWO2_12_FULL_65_11]